jgi:hypothetical protein
MRKETKSGDGTISLGRLQYIRWVNTGPTQKKKTKVAEDLFLSNISVRMPYLEWERSSTHTKKLFQHPQCEIRARGNTIRQLVYHYTATQFLVLLGIK